MKVAAVTVTYNSRAHFVDKIVHALIESEIDSIVIVDNGSPTENHNLLIELQKNFASKVHLIRLNYNSGSANGFKTGIEYVQKELQDEFIWLLDDDNQPDLAALSELKKHWHKSTHNQKEYFLALLSYRSDRPNFKQAIQLESPYFVLGPINSFLGFHYSHFFQNKSRNLINKDKEYGPVAVAPYGGLFFHRNILDKIGLPDQTFYLYGDDYDFSYRITAQDGKIELVSSSIIKDLETSFHLKKEKKTWNRFFKTDSETRIFYSVRNGMWFERKFFVNNKPIYFFNLIIYMNLLTLQFFLRPSHLYKLKLIFRGVIAGLKDRR